MHRKRNQLGNKALKITILVYFCPFIFFLIIPVIGLLVTLVGGFIMLYIVIYSYLTVNFHNQEILTIYRRISALEEHIQKQSRLKRLERTTPRDPPQLETQETKTRGKYNQIFERKANKFG